MGIIEEEKTNETKVNNQKDYGLFNINKEIYDLVTVSKTGLSVKS